MLFRLAWSNVYRAGYDYLVYLLTLILVVAFVYAFNTVPAQMDCIGAFTPEIIEFAAKSFGLVTLVLAVVMSLMLVHAGSFITNRRRKEIGLYLFLGMTRKAILADLALEATIVTVLCFVMGLALGFFLSQIMVFFTALLFEADSLSFHFIFSLNALGNTFLAFLFVYLFAMIYSLWMAMNINLSDLKHRDAADSDVKHLNPRPSLMSFCVGVAMVLASCILLFARGRFFSDAYDLLLLLIVALVLLFSGTLVAFMDLPATLFMLFKRSRRVYWSGFGMFTLRQLTSKTDAASLSYGSAALVLFAALSFSSYGVAFVGSLAQSPEWGSSTGSVVGYLLIYIASILFVACLSLLSILHLTSAADAQPSCRTLLDLGCSVPRVCHSLLIQQSVECGIPLLVGLVYATPALGLLLDFAQIYDYQPAGAAFWVIFCFFVVLIAGYFAATHVMSVALVKEVVNAKK